MLPEPTDSTYLSSVYIYLSAVIGLIDIYWDSYKDKSVRMLHYVSLTLGFDLIGGALVTASYFYLERAEEV